MIISKTAQLIKLSRDKNKVIGLSIPERQAVISGQRVFFQHTKTSSGTFWRVVSRKSGQFVSNMPTLDEIKELEL
ncbi:hypothetical protein N9137_02180 [Pseudomonadales bacterium]|nr:hypothetical protein [Pseudomonadales bacterium]